MLTSHGFWWVVPLCPSTSTTHSSKHFHSHPYEIIIKYSKSRLNSSSPNYAWFMQYKGSDNGDGRVISLPLGMHYEP